MAWPRLKIMPGPHPFISIPEKKTLTMPTEKRLSLEGHEIAYWDEGEGVPLFFIHGLTASKESWTPNLAQFTGRYRVIALDLPGFGHSAKPPIDYSIALYGGVVSAFLANLGIERPHFIGNSMGGHISMLYALDRPTEVRSLVLVDAAGANVDF